MNTSTIPPHVPPHLVVDADIYNLEGAAEDPQLAWKALARPGPGLVWTPRNGGHWIATSAKLIWELFPDVDRLSARDISVPPGNTIYPMIPNQSDEPEHAHYRRIVMPFVSPKAVRNLHDSVRALAGSLMDGFLARGECEFIGEFSRHLPMRIFLSLVELPEDDRPWLLQRADIVVRSGDVDAKIQAQREMIGYLQKWIDERKANPGADLLSAIIHGKVGDRPMNAEEIMGECLDVMFGGLDTVASMMGFVMRFLATHPEHYRQLVEDPEIIPLAVEEMFRRHGVATIARRVLKDIEVDGVTVPAGDMIVLPTCLHGLDEAMWEDALTVRFDRRRQTHATFGNGNHNCPGAGLARSEINIMLEEWIRRIPRFSLKPGTRPFGNTGSVNCIERLELCWPVEACRRD